MGKEEIIDLLEKENRWMTTKEVSEILETSRSNVSRHLKQLADRGEISVKEGRTEGRYKIGLFKIKN